MAIKNIRREVMLRPNDLTETKFLISYFFLAIFLYVSSIYSQLFLIEIWDEGKPNE